MLNKCDPLNGLCALLYAVETHLMRRDFMNPKLCDPLLPEDTPLQFIDSVDLRKTVYAHPIVAYNVGDIVIQRSDQARISGVNINDMSVGINFIVSTAVKTLTQALAFEIGSVLWALEKPLRSENLFMLRAVVGTVNANPENHCYESMVQVSAGLGKPMWKSETVEGIVREVRLRMSAS
jgi:hypothetical protein